MTDPAAATAAPACRPCDAPSVLAISSELPWPLDSGGHLRTYHMLRALALRFRLRLIAPLRPGQGAGPLQRLGIAIAPVAVAPRPAWAEAARAAGALARGEPYVLYRRHDRGAVRAAIRRELGRDPPDLIYLDHLDPCAFHRLLPAIPWVVDMHNVYSSLAERAAREQPFPWTRLYLRHEAGLLRRAERHAARAAGTLLTVSEEDRRYYAALGPAAVHVVPNGVDCEAYEGLAAGRRGGTPLLVYVGAMGWAPNARAAQILAQEVLPKVRARYPDARVRIVGRDPTPEVRALADFRGIEVTGVVPDVRPHLAAAHALVVPLESGGGTRLKILEAFAAGLPVVSTPIGCEGLEAEPGEHLLVADRDGLADAVLRLLDQPELGDRLAGRARDLARGRYDWEAVGGAACEAIGEALRRPHVPGAFPVPEPAADVAPC